MQCRQCGTESAEPFKFCAHCGHPFLPEPDTKQDGASPDNAHLAGNEHTQQESDHSLRLNPFSDFYSPQPEISGWHRGLLIVMTMIVILGAAASAAYYFGHRKYEIAELAKLHTSAPAALAPSTLKADEIFPCPSTMPFCIGGTASKIKDPVCVEAKPVWAHYSEDGGTTWKRAGCYATEAEARQGLSNVLGLAESATDKKPASQKNVETKSEKKVVTQAQVAQLPKHTIPPAQHDAEHAPKGYHVSFKGPFGITVEKRTYPTEQMRQQALDLWDREKKILEPDGSINDKYVLRSKPVSGLIPGH